jgi:deoxyhypusine synthase
VPKNFTQDTVVCAEVLGKNVPMHQYAIQITVADVRDGACSSSTLKEASSWGKVDTLYEQMVYAEATTIVPLIASYLYHKGDWQHRRKFEWTKLFEAKKTDTTKPAIKAVEKPKVLKKKAPKTLAKKVVKKAKK